MIQLLSLQYLYLCESWLGCLLYLTSKELLAVALTTAHFFASLGLLSSLKAQVCYGMINVGLKYPGAPKINNPGPQVKSFASYKCSDLCQLIIGSKHCLSLWLNGTIIWRPGVLTASLLFLSLETQELLQCMQTVTWQRRCGDMSGGPASAASVVEWLRPSEQTSSLQRQEQMMSLQMPFKTRTQQLSQRKRNN